MILLLVAVLILTVGVFVLSALTGAPYVPTLSKEVQLLFREGRPLSATDLVVDIGSGDGVVLREVSRCGARAVGFEINPYLVLISRVRLRKHKARVAIHLANFWRAELPRETTVVYTFGESRDIAKMYKRVQQEVNRLDRAVDFISYGFEVPGAELIKKHRAYFLYRITPLHSDEAQV